MIEIGKKYETINCTLPENNGLIVTVTGYAGYLKGWCESSGPRWYIDTIISGCREAMDTGERVNHIGAYRLKPLYDGNEKTSWKDLEGIWQPPKITEPA